MASSADGSRPARADSQDTAPDSAFVDPTATTVVLPGQGNAAGQVAPAAAQPGAPPRDFGRYRILSQLGAGAMGIVLLAEDPQLCRKVALKIPKPALLNDPARLTRFYNEARAAAQCQHPNLCPIYEAGEVGDLPYLCMAYVDGVSLAQQLSDKTPRSPRQCADLARTIALALAELHSCGVVHRDVKPANILLDRRGQPIIADFGLALWRSAIDPRQTEPGTLVGTPHYMSPEQFTGELESVGPASDVYALGAVLYELLTGEPPFVSTSFPKLFNLVVNETIRPTPPSNRNAEIDPTLSAICLRALEKPIANRFASMHDFANALTEYLAQPAAALSSGSQVRRAAIRFEFIGLGQHVPSAAECLDRVYLDVGNDLRPGVIDHHQKGGSSTSAASLVLANPQLLAQAVKPWRRPDDRFVIVLHEAPDLDCVACAFLAVAQLTEGRYPDGAEMLARYVDGVDAGALGHSLANPYSVYAAYQQLSHRLSQCAWPDPNELWRQCVIDGMRLLDFALAESLRAGGSILDCDAFRCPGLFRPLDRQEVVGDIERYQRKLADPNCRACRATLRLPGQWGGLGEAEALLVRDVQNLDDPDRCLFFKDWARSDRQRAPAEGGFVALSVFMSEGTTQKRRCILSVRPGSGVSLQGLAAALDQAESARRTQLFGVDDRIEDPATHEPIPPRPGYPNTDPWYDGQAHGYTIVDSPRAGTLLSADEIEAIFLHFGGRSTADLTPL